MTSTNPRPIALDTWALWEVVHDTLVGRKIRARHLADRRRPSCSAMAIAELVVRVRVVDPAADIKALVNAVASWCDVQPVTLEIAELGGRLREELRRADRDASLGDALHLATARVLGATLISVDAAYGGQPDVASS